MPQKISEALFLEAAERHRADAFAISNELKLDLRATRQRLERYKSRGLLTGTKPTPHLELRAAKEKLRTLEDRLLTDEYVKEEILKLSRAVPTPPAWTLKPPSKISDLTGVPTLFFSDWHWGEVVRPSEIGGVNEYNLAIAHKRAEAVTSIAIELLTKHLSSARYPGVCLLLGGDMISGDIHEELRESNEEPTMVIWLDLLGVLETVIKQLADTFGKVFIVGVTGNHGRNTHKPRAKRRNHSNFDWLLYQILNRRFSDDSRVTMQIPDGPDALFKLYNHRYCLTHGDQFRGGDGIIGPLGPITRGDIKKRSRQAQMQAGYDTLLMGHFHQLIQLHSMIVNGSLKGYDEYASQLNFKFESPRQALWVTHPQMGITFSMPVYAERPGTAPTTDWVSVAA